MVSNAPLSYMIVLCALIAACHAPRSANLQDVRVETWEVANGSPCEARVRITSYGGQAVQSLGTVPAGATQTFEVLSSLTKDNAVSAIPLEPDGTSLCQNNQNNLRKVVVRKLTPP